jgi:hypothetical protein
MIIDSREDGPKTFHLSVGLPESLKMLGNKKQNFVFFEDTWKNYVIAAGKQLMQENQKVALL